MYKVISNLATVYLAASLLILSPSATACVAIIHDIGFDPIVSTEVTMEYSCIFNGSDFCRIVIRKDGATLSTTEINTSGYHAKFKFDHGPGKFDVTVNAYKGVYAGRGGYSYSIYDSETSSVTVMEPEPALSTSYFYDANGRLEKVEQSDGTVTEYGYDDANNRTSKTTKK